MKFRTTFTTISRGEDQFEVVDGIVDCPAEIGRELGLEPVSADAPPTKTDDKSKGGKK